MHWKNRLGRSGVGILAMSACAFLWSIAGLFIKIIDWNPFLIAGLRSLIASLVVLAWLKRPKFTFSLPQLGAAFANAATMLLFVSANKATTAASLVTARRLIGVRSRRSVAQIPGTQCVEQGEEEVE